MRFHIFIFALIKGYFIISTQYLNFEIAKKKLKNHEDYYDDCRQIQ